MTSPTTSANPKLTFKIATEKWEFEAIYRLNYRTFAEEIPQHARSGDGRLVDKFDSENTYVICLSGGRLVGMVALRGNRPFSLDQKLENLDSHLPPGRHLCEVRLLAVEKDCRYGQVTVGLLRELSREALRRGYDAAVISGTTRQTRLYEHMGFRPFGPLVGTAEAAFQPMFLSLESFEENAATLAADPRRAAKAPRREVNFLPGPVGISEVVQQAMAGPPVSHRSSGFIRDCRSVRRKLCDLTGASFVQILMGSGTLGNEVVAMQIRQLNSPGILVSNGEFGERLLDEARRTGLNFHHLRLGWGEAIKEERLREFMRQHPDAAWLWTTHCETSSSLLNDLPMLKRLTAERGMKLCLDCISSIGLVPVDLQGVHLASGASGKGLASFPGLALVFHHHPVAPNSALPRYLDLGLYAATDGVPFTVNTNLVSALKASLDTTDWREKIARIRHDGPRLRDYFQELGLQLIGDPASLTPAVVTVAAPAGHSSRALGAQFKRAGFLLSYQSEYLLRHNWLQVCLMGEFKDADVDHFMTAASALLPSPTVAAESRCAS